MQSRSHPEEPSGYSSAAAQLARIPVPVFLAGVSTATLDAQDIEWTAIRTVLDRAQKRIEAKSDIWQDRSRWENAWEVETEDVRVETTRSFAFAKAVADGEQQMVGWFQRLLGEGVGLPGKYTVHG